MSKNIFVAIEGIDGSGKSAVSILLARDINASLIKTPPPSTAFPMAPKSVQVSPGVERVKINPTQKITVI